MVEIVSPIVDSEKDKRSLKMNAFLGFYENFKMKWIDCELY